MDRAEQKFFINKPDSWPNWPFLPVKNRTRRSDGFPETGIIHAAQLTTVRLVNLFRITQETWDAAEKLEFEDLDSLLDAGWEVD